MRPLLCMGTITCLALVTVCSQAESAVVTPRQVIRALRNSAEADLFEDVHDDDVVVPSVPVRGGEPELEIVRAVRGSGTSVFVQVRCSERACLPFVARVACGIACEARIRGAKKGRAVFEKPKPLLKRGDPATLVFVSPGLKISVAVVCLGPGAPGEIVRVFSPASRKVFAARVEGPGLVTGVTESGVQR